MITEKDLREAIAECQGERKPNANTCIKLAAYYTILENINVDQAPATRQAVNYVDKIDYDGESEFAKTINGRNFYEVMDVIDELMQTLSVINPRLYDGVMNKLI